ncbi:MAG: DNA-binding response regulator [Cytophagales bacterium]|nr:MAG: DNA-binding response regulator [Cytophagales bacterium]
MTCILIDDEPLAREGLADLIGQIPTLTLLGAFSNARDAGAFLATKPVDLLLLDIQMPEQTGLDFAHSLPTRPLLIFTTAYPQFALDSYELDAVDYLLKPIRRARLEKAIQKADQYRRLLQEVGQQDDSVHSDHFFVRADRRNYKVMFSDVLFIKGLKDYVVIHTKDKKLITAMNIKTVSQHLPTTQFLRISKSFVVNAAYVTAFDSTHVYLGDEEIPFGAVYRDSFLEQYRGKPGLT